MLVSRLSGAGWLSNAGSVRRLTTAAKPTSTTEEAASRPETVHAKRIRRASVRNAKIAARKPITSRLASYFQTKKVPTKIKISKTMAKLMPYLGTYPPKYDIDESTLSNAEYIKNGIHKEVRAPSCNCDILVGMVSLNWCKVHVLTIFSP